MRTFYCIKIILIFNLYLDHRKFDERRILGGVNIVWSNGSTDVAGEISETGGAAAEDIEEFTVALGENENIQKLEVCSGWFIEKIKLVTNLGHVFGPWGGDGGEERRPHKHIRKGVNPRHVYLDGIRGYVVRTQGAKAINRISFKWSFVMDKKISRSTYHHSVVLRSETERISVLDLERDINLTDGDIGDAAPSTRRDWHPRHMFHPEVYFNHWSDEDEMRSPPVPHNHGVFPDQDPPALVPQEQPPQVEAPGDAPGLVLAMEDEDSDDEIQEQVIMEEVAIEDPGWGDQ